MPRSLRARMGLVGFLAVLLIPVAASSLRGLTHVLTCHEPSGTPFTITVPRDGPPVISSVAVVERGEGGEAQPGTVCGGLRLDLAAGSPAEGRAEVALTITNLTDFGWRGSVALRLNDLTIPVDIGEIPPGQRASDVVELRLRPGGTYELAGEVLLGP